MDAHWLTCRVALATEPDPAVLGSSFLCGCPSSAAPLIREEELTQRGANFDQWETAAYRSIYPSSLPLPHRVPPTECSEMQKLYLASQRCPVIPRKQTVLAKAVASTVLTCALLFALPRSFNPFSLHPCFPGIHTLIRCQYKNFASGPVF